MAKFRYNAAVAIAAVVALCGAVPLATSRWWLSFVLLVPLAALVWGWRAGVDVHEDELVVRWPLGSRHIRRDQIRGFMITRRAVRVALADESMVWLPAVPGARVPVLAEALGLQTSPPAADDDQPSEGDTGGEPERGDSRAEREQHTGA